MSKTLYQSQTVNFETGEIVESTRVETKKIEYYYSQFSDDIATEILNLTGLELKVLMLLEIHADPKTNEPILGKNDRRKMLNNIGISTNTYYVIRARLRKKGMLIIHRDIVIVNPLYFWRGTVRDRELLLEELRDDRLSTITFK